MNSTPVASNYPVRFHRSIRTVLPAVLLVIALGWAVTSFAPSAALDGPVVNFGAEGEARSITFPIFLLVAALLIARPLLLMGDSRYEITDHHVRATSGRCSLKTNEVELAYEDMAGAKVTQTLLERVLNVGTIIGWTSVGHEPEIVMKGVARPHHFARLIRAKIDEVRVRERRGPASASSS